MPVKQIARKYLWVGVGVVLVALFLLLQSDAVTAFMTSFVDLDIDRQNLAFLHKAQTQATDNILILSEILAALEIVQSAEIGFNFVGSASVQVGQALAGLSFALEKTLLASLVAAGLYEALIILVRLASLLNPFIFQLVLLAGAVHFFSHLLPVASPVFIISRIVLRGSMVVFLASFVILPYSVNVSGWFASSAPFGSSSQHSEKLRTFHAHVITDQLSRRSFSYWNKEHAVRGQYLKFVEGLPHTVGQTMQHAISITLHALFIGILLPIGVFGFLWWILRYYVEHTKWSGKFEQIAKMASDT